MKILFKIIFFRSRFGLYFLMLPTLISLSISHAIAQCPANIDFESGTFNGWTCWTGTVDTLGGQNLITLIPAGGPVVNRHEIMSVNPGNGLDKYGQFPQNSPNGSGYSIKLGNDIGGRDADGVSYEFTIPATANKFKLIYHYAIVLQDPEHLTIQQPRFVIEALNVTDNVVIACPSLNFVSRLGLPGFNVAPVQGTSGIPVFYKDWSAASVNLDGYQGKTIRLFFKTAGCTYSNHFCYGYLDVNTQCSSSFESSAFCPTDTVVNLKAPVGFQNYAWYNGNFSQLLGSQQTLQLSPLPIPGSVISVILTPKAGYGCNDTLTAQLLDTLSVKANAGPDISTCNLVPVQLGIAPLPGLVYKWSPATGLDNPDISNPMATPSVPTTYILTVRSTGGGCTTADTVQVNPKVVNSTVTLTGNADYCIGSGPFPVLRVNPADSIQWFKDSIAINGAILSQYTVRQSGKYFAQLFSNTCPLPVKTKETTIVVDSPLPGVNYPVQDAVFNFPLQLQARQFGNSVLWAPSINLDNQKSYSPIFRGINQQLYTIQIKTAAGCLTVDTQLVTTRKKIEIFVPAAFTPGGDGKNDFLRPVLMGIVKVNYFRIYDRWGHLLFEMKSDLPGWDGKINGQPQEIQTVVWMIEAVDVDGKVHYRQGTTVLYR